MLCAAQLQVGWETPITQQARLTCDENTLSYDTTLFGPRSKRVNFKDFLGVVKLGGGYERPWFVSTIRPLGKQCVNSLL